MAMAFRVVIASVMAVAGLTAYEAHASFFCGKLGAPIEAWRQKLYFQLNCKGQYATTEESCTREKKHEATSRARLVVEGKACGLLSDSDDLWLKLSRNYESVNVSGVCAHSGYLGDMRYWFWKSVEDLEAKAPGITCPGKFGVQEKVSEALREADAFASDVAPVLHALFHVVSDDDVREIMRCRSMLEDKEANEVLKGFRANDQATMKWVSENAPVCTKFKLVLGRFEAFMRIKHYAELCRSFLKGAGKELNWPLESCK